MAVCERCGCELSSLDQRIGCRECGKATRFNEEAVREEDYVSVYHKFPSEI